MRIQTQRVLVVVPRSRRLILVLFLLSSQFAFLVILFDGNVSDSNGL